MTEFLEETAIGIDLGTTNSCAACMDAQTGMPKIVRNLEGKEITPSVVYIKDNEVVVGDVANDIGRVRNPENTVYEVKRMLGYKFDDAEMKEIRRRMPHNTFQFDLHGRARISVQRNGREVLFAPEQISAMVLSKIKRYAGAALHKNVTSAVITVPAYFNESQRAATRTAAELAGLKVLKLLNEPTAAAIAYGCDKVANGRSTTVLVYDFGGGTLDVTLMKVERGTFTTLATTGNTQLGGQDFDECIMQYCLTELRKQHDPFNTDPKIQRDLEENHKLRQRLLHEAEKLKKNLSQVEEAEILLDCLFRGRDLEVMFNRKLFEHICAPLFEQCLAPVKECLQCARVDPSAVDEIVLAGGSSRMPKVQTMLHEFFRKSIRRNLDADTAIARGAAIIAMQCWNTTDSRGRSLSRASTSSKIISFSDVVPLALGIRSVEIREKVSCFGLRRRKSIDGDNFAEVITAQTRFPCTGTRPFFTSKDNQTCVTFEVFQGKHKSVSANHFLGNFEARHLPPRPAGQVSFTAEFSIDEDGCLVVRAVEQGQGVEVGAIRVKDLTSSSAWTDEELEKMRREVSQAMERDPIGKSSSGPVVVGFPTANVAKQLHGGFPAPVDRKW